MPQVLIFIISKTITTLDQFSISFVTSDLKLSTLKQEKYTLTVLGAGKSKIKVGPDMMSDEGQLPGSQTVIFLLCPLMAKG